jgi:RecB family exonuclease
MAENSISYSQFSMYLQCPKKWEQEYALNKRVFEQSIHTIFGTAVHEVLQNYLTVMYSQSAKKADEIDVSSDLQSRMVRLYQDAAKKTGHFSTPEELQEFWKDGIEILSYFKRKRNVYFSSRNEELLGIETELGLNLVSNLKFKGFIDVVIRDKRTGRIRIIDLKTSTRGWNKYQKADKTKTAQLILYKEFYGKQFGVDPEMIDVEYIILRRKINEDSDFPMKRIQTFSPPSGKPSRNKVGNGLTEFIKNAFNEDGSYNLEGEYPAIASSSCKYCKYKNDSTICPVAKRLKKS